MTASDGATVRSPQEVERTVSAVWRIESAKIVATLTRMVGDFSLAEDLAQDALLEALRQWPDEGVPRNPAAWLTAVGAVPSTGGAARSATTTGSRRSRTIWNASRRTPWMPIPGIRMPSTTTCCG